MMFKDSLLATYIIIVVLGATLQWANSAGMNTHTMIAVRATKYLAAVSKLGSSRFRSYDKVIKENFEALEAGADFPDFLYACGDYKDHHDAGEVAHWPVFHAAMVEYIRHRTPDFQLGPKYWRNSTKQLISFLFGVSVHYISDELWEGLTSQLGNGYGFVRTLARINLNLPGDTDNAEGTANLAADFYVAWLMDESEIKPEERQFPLEDIKEIYHMTPKNATHNFTDVTLSSLKQCRELFNLGLWAEKTFGSVLFLYYTALSNKLPFVAERFIDLPVGGLDYMATFTTFVWDRIAMWLDKGVPTKPVPRIALDSEDDLFTYRFFKVLARYRKDWRFLKTLSSKSQELFEIVDPNLLEKGIYITAYKETDRAKRLLKDILQSIVKLIFPQNVDIPVTIKPKRNSSSLVVESKSNMFERPHLSITNGLNPISYYGNSIVSGDFDKDGLEDLVVGAYSNGLKGIAPQRGSVYIMYGNGLKQELIGVTKQGRFGWSLLVMDFNLDGIDDLIVGAPLDSWRPDELPVKYNEVPNYRCWGKVYIYFGRKASAIGSANVTFYAQRDFLTFGSVLAEGDMNADGNKDLLIGSPFANSQNGSVFVVLSSSNPRGEGENQIPIERAAFMRFEGSDGDWFGSSLVVHLNRLYVGAPGHRATTTIDKFETVGCVYSFEIERNTSQPALTIIGTEPRGELGASMVLLPSTLELVVGAPSEGITNSGSVYVLLPTIHRMVGTYKINDEFMKGSLCGTRAFGRFGANVIASKSFEISQNTLIVGAPLTNNLRNEQSVIVESGCIYIYHVNKNTHYECGNYVTSNRKICGTSWGERFGKAIHVYNNTVVVGSPYATVDGREMAGKITAFGLMPAHSKLPFDIRSIART